MSRHRWLRPAVALAALVALAVGPARPAAAHPLGNLTSNAAVDVVVKPDALDVTYVLDLAELPTVQARQEIDAAGESTWAAERCATLAAGLRLGAAGPAVAADPPELTYPPGQAGLATLRLVCPLRAGAPSGAALTVEDANDADRVGWREVVVRGDGMRLASSDAPDVSPSALLTAYPTGTPLRQVRATFTAVPDGAAVARDGSTAAPVAPATRGADGLTRQLQRAVAGHDLGLPLALAAVALALVLGGLHSLAPGHGKTMMAATVLARRGAAAREVLTIGATVAATHTIGVLVLGTAIWTSQALAPEHVLSWLTLASGALLVVTGAMLLVRRRGFGHGHHHHDHDHAHHGHAHDDHHDHDQDGHDDHHAHDHHAHDHHAHGHHAHHGHGRAPVTAGPIGRRWLVAMGVAGGLVPTPSALVVLLGAAALGRTWFGVVLVAVYGIGMAATLLVAGVALVRLQGWLERRWYATRWLALTMRVAPVVTATALMGGGLLVAARAMAVT